MIIDGIIFCNKQSAEEYKNKQQLLTIMMQLSLQSKNTKQLMVQLVNKIKNAMRKKFRIVNNEVYCPEAFHPLWYRIEQRYTVLFFIHWWGTPTFAPPHLFESPNSAIKAIKDKYPNAIIYDYYSDNKRKV